MTREARERERNTRYEAIGRIIKYITNKGEDLEG